MPDEKHFKSILQFLETSQTSDKISRQLALFFENLKLHIVVNSKITPEDIKDISHLKETKFEKQTLMGLLKLELMYFGNSYWTGLHSHPEYVIDKVISGSLREKTYCLITHSYKQENLRVSSEFSRNLYDPQEGFPHNVIGNEPLNISLCLTLGFNSVKNIEIA